MPPALPLQRNFPLDRCNTFGIAARAAAYLPVTDIAELTALRSDASLAAMRRLVLGGGSNLVLTGDFDGLVVHLRTRGIEIVGEHADAVLVRAAAGESWHGLVQWTLDHGLAGLENLALIPGSVGASPIQNIGAYGIELKDRFHSLRFFDLTSGDLLTLDREGCRFAYRDSIFKHALQDRGIVVDVTFALPKQWQPCIDYGDIAAELASREVSQPDARAIAAAVIAIRSRKLPDPAIIGNAGSFFKNPVVPARQRDDLLQSFPGLVSFNQPDGRYKLAAGWLIDQCGWKGKSLGAAGVYPKQALVLINLGGATGADVLRLAEAIQADVAARFGVQLEPEPVFV